MTKLQLDMAYRGLIGSALVSFGALLFGCGSSDGATPSNSSGSGGTVATGSGASGGSTSSGAASATGGADATGDSGGSSSSGGAMSSGGGTSSGGTSATGGLPPLHVDGTEIKDPSGNTVILRGVSLIDLGALYAWGATANSADNINARIDKIFASGLEPHVLRLPVYPRTVVNAGYPTYSPAPFPIGDPPPESANLRFTPIEMTPDEYFTNIMEPAVEYASSKGMYVIIDYHQIDDTTDNSVGAAVSFWQYVAPKFKDRSDVIYEAFNEPIDISGANSGWAGYASAAQQMIDTIRQGAPDNLIIVGSPSWSQQPGDAIGKITGSNLVLTAHIYPGNWSDTFQAQIDTARTVYPVFISEWGYGTDNPSDTVGYTDSPTWGTDLQTYIDGNGSSWTAWVTDDSWTPKMFKSIQTGTLTDFGTLVKDWLTATADSDWVDSP